MRKGMRMLAIEHARRGGEMENRFRDRTGREHYDDGRFAPMRNDTNIEIEGRFRDDRGRERYDDGRFAPMSRYGMNDRNGYVQNGYGAESRYPYGPFPVYRDNAGMRGGGDMNQIGFNANREMDMGGYRMDAGYEMRNEMEHRPGMRMAGGHASGMGGMVEPMTKEKAEEWVRSMKGANGMPGQHWTMEQAKQIMARNGYHDEPVEFFVALNMMKSDYSKPAQKMGMDKEEFYAAMADAFLNDEDAHKDKLARYYEYIAKR